MTLHRKCLKWSIVISCIAIICYSIFGYVKCIMNLWLKDVALAICGSAILLIATSIVSYITEKRRIEERIVKASVSFSMTDYILEEGTQLSIQSLAKITKISLTNLNSLYNELREYYQGCILKDEILKNLINNDIIPYAEKIENFRVLLSNPNCESEQVNIKFDDLWESEKTLNNKIDTWLKGKKFILGDEFKIEEQEK